MRARRVMGVWLLVLIWNLDGGSLGFAASVPQTLPGWRMELVAEAPQVNHPTVVCTAPDGRIFVAEDPMDIRTPRADATEGRILCLHPGGRITVFAENLHAVFGLQYLEGKLYVLHNPKFSVFTDNQGLGRDRVDLIEQTNPKPWALDWNDHVPANFRLGLDGFFYVAVGDKGLYGAVGRDGSRVDLPGGGILRLRPDGTQLEVFARGVRNIMDVAMNAEDELFTYDNTDEHDWMGRLTHMVERGFYGYPHDFIPRRPYTLWMMHDFGGGAATGTECYTEDALPLEYQGNLFLADFGKRQVLRVWIERSGATYRVVKHQEMFPQPPDDFRPVGLAWSADGLGLFICDWAHRDTKENVKVGRLWKLTYTGSSLAKPKPDWHAAAALGRTFTATTSDLVEALGHPSRHVRLTAQRKLAERARAADPREREELTGSLVKLLQNEATPTQPRMHALWTLDGLDEGRSARAAMVDVARRGTDVATRRQAIRQLGLRRAPESAAILADGLRSPDASLQRHAATALGRLGSMNAVPDLLLALVSEDAFARFAAFSALNQIGRKHPEAWGAIAAGLSHTNARIRGATAFALRETYDEQLLQVLVTMVQAGDSQRAAALGLLAALHHQTPVWKGEWWAYHPALSPAPEKIEAWAGTKTVLATLSAAIRDSSPAVRLGAVEGLLAARHTNSAPALRAAFAQEAQAEVRRAILRTLAGFRDLGAAPLVAGLLRQPPTDTALTREAVRAAVAIGGPECRAGLAALAQSPDPARMEAIKGLGELREQDAVPTLVTALKNSSPEIRIAAMEALGQIKGDGAFAALENIGRPTSVEERRALARALGHLESSNAVPRLLELWREPETRADALTALNRRGDARALDAYLTGLASANPAVRAQSRKALTTIRDGVLVALELRTATLSPAVIAELREVYRDHDVAKQGPLFATKDRGTAPEDYARFALENPGDAVRGQRVFWDEAGVACIRCHTVAGHGAVVGPDMTLIGVQFPRRELIEHVLHPSRVVREGYQQVIVETAEGESVSGLVASETAERLVLRDAQGQLQSMAKSRITRRTASELSLMPEGLHVGLRLEQFADLLAFLESRRTDPRQSVEPFVPKGFRALSPGRDLSDWRELPPATQRVDAQALKLRRPPEHWFTTNRVIEHDGLTGDLWTAREFGDFELRLEWRWVDAPKWEEFPLINAAGLEAGPDGRAATQRVLDAGDSGLLLRGLYKAQANLFCYPVGSGEFWEYRTDPNSSPEQRRAFTPKRSADRPVGDWNEMQIQLTGDRITITLNGEEVITRAELPGLPVRGPIGLQHEHGRIQFRNVCIQEKPPAP